jgi:hypothetical protein
VTMKRSEIMKRFGTLLQRAACGDLDAVELMVDTFLVAHVWDDLVDKDRSVCSGEINGAFYIALVKIPLNPFYQKNIVRLAQFIERAAVDWFTATEWEKRGSMTLQQLEVAYVTRSSYTQIITEVALICGGFDHALDVQEEVRLTMHDETVSGYMMSLRQEA